MDETQLERWRAAIGPNAERYLARFKRIREAGGWAPGWNGAAFWHSTGWFCYRRMYAWALVNLCAPFVAPVLLAALFSSAGLRLFLLAYPLIAFVVLPVFADTLYYRHLQLRLATGKTPLAPSPATLWGACGFAAAWLAAGIVIVLIANAAYADFSVRAKVHAAVAHMTPLRDEIAEFYARERRLPARHELRPKTAEPLPRYLESVAYDAAGKRIVATLGEFQQGRKIALYAHEENGTLSWRCRAIGVQRKLLPAHCRE